MSREEVLNLTDSNEVKGLTIEEDEELKEYAIRQVQVLDRVSSRFTIAGAPEDLHYEWHPDDPETHDRLISQGFILDDGLGKKSNYAHTDGAGVARNADVRVYSIPKRKYAVLQQIRQEAAQRRTDPKRAVEDFKDKILKSQIPGLEVVDDQTSTVGRKLLNDEVAHILNKET